MGWNQVSFKQKGRYTESLPEGSHFYFVHSFYVAPEDDSVTLGSCDYGDVSFTAILERDNIFATQFHPEKSQQAGLEILERFAKG